MTRQFYTIDTYGGHARHYQLLPFRFVRLEDDELLVNEAGEYLFTPRGTVQELVRHRLSTATPLYQTLKARHFLCDQESAPLLDVLATKCRTKKSFLDGFTKLHIMVLTLRCDNSCHYCQVSRKNADQTAYDMTQETALRSLEWIMRSPSDHLTLEFQGGEPLLAFDLVRFVAEHAKDLAAKHRKELTVVLATNLIHATDEILAYLRDADIKISTSLDGPAFLHNANRPRPGTGDNGYEITVNNIRRAREYVGPENVSALMTATQMSLQYPREIVDEYVRQGFGSIFLRSVNPYGLAATAPERTGYQSAEFLAFYKAALDYVIALNRQGTNLTELYAKIVLTKILTPYPTGYVDLQSPTGAGISVLAYNYNGDVYASDESRMLGEMQDHTFRLGSVHRDSYTSIINSPAYQYLMSASCNETLPGCADCAYQAYCGSDPVRHHATQGDAYGHRPTSGFCAKNRGIIGHIFRLLRNADSGLMRIFFAWIRDKRHEDLNARAVCD